jgi:hypothetical protein
MNLREQGEEKEKKQEQSRGSYIVLAHFAKDPQESTCHQTMHGRTIHLLHELGASW